MDTDSTNNNTSSNSEKLAQDANDKISSIFNKLSDQDEKGTQVLGLLTDIRNFLAENSQRRKKQKTVVDSSVSSSKKNSVGLGKEGARDLVNAINQSNLAKYIQKFLSTVGMSYNARNPFGRSLYGVQQWFGTMGSNPSTWSAKQYQAFQRIMTNAKGKGYDRYLKAYDALYKIGRSRTALGGAFNTGKALFYGLTGGSGAKAGMSMLSKAGLLGSGAIGSFIGGPIGTVALMGLTTAATQLQKAIEENTKAILGGNWANSRLTMGAAGDLSMWGVPGKGVDFNAGSYQAYRSKMRMMGLRDDQAVANALTSLSGMGIYGFGGQDAVGAALSRQAMRTRIGANVSDEFVRRMYIATQGQKQGAFHVNGAFSLEGFARQIAAVSNRSMNKQGVRLGTQNSISIVEQMTQDLLGMDNNISAVTAALDKFSKQLTTGKLTTQEFINMFNGQNMAGSEQGRLNIAAISAGRHGSVLSHMYDMMVRNRDMTGRVTNWQENSAAILSYFRKIGIGKDKESTMLGMYSGGGQSLLEMFNLGALSKNPRYMEILSAAAAGDRKGIDALTKISEDEKGIMYRQAKTLDAIRNPVEHMRDVLFATMKVGVFESIGGLMSKGRARQMEYDKWRTGMSDEQFETYKQAKEYEYKQDIAEQRSAIGQVLSAAMESIGAKMNPQIEALIKALDDNTKSRSQVTGYTYLPAGKR